ncbi:ATP-binding protein [Megalodesulfovibrio paquesii]
MKCKRCKATAAVALPSHHTGFCDSCFLEFVERQVEKGIRSQRLFSYDDRILLALSGGKDSLAMAHILRRMGYCVHGVHLDLGIPDSSAPAREKVEAFCAARGITLDVVELAEEGLAIPLVKEHINRPICSACGTIKRQLFNREAVDGGFTVLATGHNLDDETSRLFANTIRWDAAQLADQGPMLPAGNGFVRKVKPMWRLSEFETAAYCFLSGIDYHMGACPYSRGASFTGHKALLAGLEENSPGQKLQFYLGFLEFGRQAFRQVQAQSPCAIIPCSRCGHPTNNELCAVCRMRDAIACTAGSLM